MNISWIKLDVNILDDSKIKLLRKYPDGNQLFVLWIGLLCLAMKSEQTGLIEVSNGVPYTIEDLSVVLDIDLNTVKLGLQLFQKMKMIEIIDNETILIINFEKHQNIYKIIRERELTRERVQKFRDKKRQECNALPPLQKPVTNGNVTIQNKNIDIELEKRNKDKNKKISARSHYDLELKKIEGNTEGNSEFYRTFVKCLFGENKNNITYDGVLSIPKQLTYNEFCTLMAELPKDKKLFNYINDMENDPKYYKNKKSLYLTLSKWFKMNFNNSKS